MKETKSMMQYNYFLVEFSNNFGILNAQCYVGKESNGLIDYEILNENIEFIKSELKAIFEKDVEEATSLNNLMAILVSKYDDIKHIIINGKDFIYKMSHINFVNGLNCMI